MEILQDTIIKLIVRQGSDSDRQMVVLTSGEHGYATDTKRVFIGDGVTNGGNLVGNLYTGDFTGITPPTPSEIGDLAFNTDTRKLYRLKLPDTGNISQWSEIGGVYVSGDNKIAISNTNVITLCALSGGSLSPDLVQYPITLSGGKISLPPLSANTVSENLLRYPIVLSGGKISLPPLSANTVSENLLRYPIVLSGGKISLPPLSAGNIDNDSVVSPIYVNGSGRIALNPLSAGNIDNDSVVSPIYVNGSGRIALNPLSAGSVSSDLLNFPIFLSGGKISLSLSSIATSAIAEAPIIVNNGKIALSAKIPFERVSTNHVNFGDGFTITDDNTALTIPNGTNFNLLSTSILIDYTTPALTILTALTANLEGPIVYNASTQRIGLSAQFPFQRVSTKTVTVSSGLVAYVNGVNQGTTPINPLSANIVLALNPLSANSLSQDVVSDNIIITNGRLALSANIPFQRVSTKTITASAGLHAYVDGVYQDANAINPLSANIVLQTNQLFIRFDGATGTNTYSRGISGIRVGLGQYLFRYGPLPTANIYPFIQIHSLTSHRYTARTMSLNVSALSVTIVQADSVFANNFADADMFLQINY